MSPLRRSLTSLVAAGYAVVAVVVGGGHPFLHNHGCTQGEVTAEAGHEHHHHGHDASDADHNHDHDVPEHSCPDHQHDGSHSCVVCQYLAQQPLPVAIVATPDVSDWCRPLAVIVELRATSAPLLPHPARGPPLSA